MQKADLVQGHSYALRTPKGVESEEPLLKVRFDGKSHKSKVHVRFLTGDLTGLDEWVRTIDLACPWGERRSFLRDVERMDRLRHTSAKAGDRVVQEAISAVLTASGEYGGFIRKWDTAPEPAQRLWSRAGLEGSPVDHHSANFVDRHGVWQLTFQTAEAVAKAFAAAEPETVDLYLRGWEERLRAEGFSPGNQHSHDLLREWAPSHALARAWSQESKGVAAEREVERLRRLAHDAARTLRKHGHDSDAARLERGLEGR